MTGNGLGAWWDGFLLSRAERETRVRQYLADLGDFDRLWQIQLRGIRELGEGHRDTAELGAHLDELERLHMGRAFPVIDAAIAQLVREGKWTWEPRTIAEAYGAQREMFTGMAGLGGWPAILVVVGMLASAVAVAFWAIQKDAEVRTIKAKALAAAIMKEADARAAAIEAGSGGTLPPGPFEVPPPAPTVQVGGASGNASTSGDVTSIVFLAALVAVPFFFMRPARG